MECRFVVRRRNLTPTTPLLQNRHQNRELNGHFGNVEFICADVLTLALPPASFDLVFSCWIQMYLNDEEVR